MLKDDRMRSIYDLTRENVTVCDVGTDHGILPIELILNKKSPRCIMTDISAPSLEKGVKNAKAAGVGKSISAYNTNGTLGVELEDKMDFIIAGMGAELIAQILMQDERLKNPDYGFVLQPMSKAEYLRTFLSENGFETECEVKVLACNRIYPIIRATYRAKAEKINDIQRYLGYGFDPNRDLDFKYAEKVLCSLGVRLKGLESSEDQPECEIERLKLLVNEIKAAIKR